MTAFRISAFTLGFAHDGHASIDVPWQEVPTVVAEEVRRLADHLHDEAHALNLDAEHCRAYDCIIDCALLDQMVPTLEAPFLAPNGTPAWREALHEAWRKVELVSTRTWGGQYVIEVVPV